MTVICPENRIAPGSGTSVAVSVTGWFRVEGFGAEVMLTVAFARTLFSTTVCCVYSIWNFCPDTKRMSWLLNCWNLPVTVPVALMMVNESLSRMFGP